jgi:ribosomal protein S18 acetylase RimI-like enzyme
VTVRPLKRIDRPRLAVILHAQRHFRPLEIQTALELIDFALARPRQKDYLILCAEEEEVGVTGYLCYGKAPMADAVYDLYWIVVHPSFWKRGTGSLLIRKAEEDLECRRARLLFIETSSQPAYEGPRVFYRKHGYREEARIQDYYAAGDHKVIYGKTLIAEKL